MNQLLRPLDDFELVPLLSVAEREGEAFEPEERSLALALFPPLRCPVCWFFSDGLLAGIVGSYGCHANRA